MVSDNPKKKVFDIAVKTIVDSIASFAKNRKEAKFQVLDLIMPKERQIRSIVGGLETSMGTTLWEPLAKTLANENGFKIVNEKLEKPVHMPASLENTLNNIISSREESSKIYNAISSKEEIKKICQGFIKNPIADFEPPPRGGGVDIWLTKGGCNYFFDTKTVQSNLGAYKAQLRQVLSWYAYFFARYPTGEAEARIVFPYNPYKSDFWKNTTGKGFPLERKNEGWVEDEFWNFCSGTENTFRIIKQAFEYIKDNGLVSKEFDVLFKKI